MWYLFVMTLGTRGPSLNTPVFDTLEACQYAGEDWSYEVNRDRASTNLVRWKCYPRGSTTDERHSHP